MGEGSNLSIDFKNKLIENIKNQFDFFNKCNNTNIHKYRAEMIVKNTEAIAMFVESYQGQMEGLFSGTDYIDSLKKYHTQISTNILREFKSQINSKDPNCSQYKNKLKESMENLYQFYKDKNKDRKELSEKVNEIKDNKKKFKQKYEEKCKEFEDRNRKIEEDHKKKIQELEAECKERIAYEKTIQAPVRVEQRPRDDDGGGIPILGPLVNGFVGVARDIGRLFR